MIRTKIGFGMQIANKSTMLVIPNLYHTRLHYISICACFPAADAVRWVQEKGKQSFDCEVGDDDAPMRISLQTDEFSSKGAHVHIFLARRDDLDKKEKTEASGTLADIRETIASFSEMEVQLRLKGNYQIDNSELPAMGSIAAMTRFSSQADKLELSLTGAELSVKGSVYRKVTWSKGKDKIRGEIYAILDDVIGDNYLDRAVTTLNDGVGVFLLARIPTS